MRRVVRRSVPLRWSLILAFGGVVANASPQPILLIYQERVPFVARDGQKVDTNVSLQPYLVPFLRELRKVQVEWYTPDHPIAQQFAQQRRVPPERLTQPAPELLAQLARAWRATYLLRVRCLRAQNQLEYRAELWQLGRRSALWQAEGFQGGGTGNGGEESSLQSLARTLAMRLDNEVWQDLPTNLPPPPEPTPPVPVRPEPATPPKDFATLLQTYLKEGRWTEALLPLRSLIHQNPTDVRLRLQLVQLYRNLNQRESALRELDSALQLAPQESALHLERAKLLREGGDLRSAISALQSALQSNPDSDELRSALVECLIEAGQIAEAENELRRWQGGSPPRSWASYLLVGATRRFEPLPAQPITLNEEGMRVWFLVVSGAVTDLASELLEMRQQARADTPNWRDLQSRAERHTLSILRLGAWLEAVQPSEALRQSVQRLRFSAQLLSQSSQQMARYLLHRRSEDEERASLLRLESLRELEAVRNALQATTP